MAKAGCRLNKVETQTSSSVQGTAGLDDSCSAMPIVKSIIGLFSVNHGHYASPVRLHGNFFTTNDAKFH